MAPHPMKNTITHYDTQQSNSSRPHRDSPATVTHPPTASHVVCNYSVLLNPLWGAVVIIRQQEKYEGIKFMDRNVLCCCGFRTFWGFSAQNKVCMWVQVTDLTLNVCDADSHDCKNTKKDCGRCALLLDLNKNCRAIFTKETEDTHSATVCALNIITLFE